jgi:hypothetical protein
VWNQKSSCSNEIITLLRFTLQFDFMWDQDFNKLYNQQILFGVDFIQSLKFSIFHLKFQTPRFERSGGPIAGGPADKVQPIIQRLPHAPCLPPSVRWRRPLRRPCRSGACYGRHTHPPPSRRTRPGKSAIANAMHQIGRIGAAGDVCRLLSLLLCTAVYIQWQYPNACCLFRERKAEACDCEQPSWRN